VGAGGVVRWGRIWGGGGEGVGPRGGGTGGVGGGLGGGVIEAEVDEEEGEKAEDAGEAMGEITAGQYAAGKWGRYLRAPDLYFRLLREHGERFVKLGEIAEIRFGIKSGCDAFFMPRDVTGEVLRRVRDGLPWTEVGVMTAGVKRSEVESGAVRIVRAGDGTLHGIEAEYLRPEVHSLMEVDRPVVRARDLERVVLWVREPLKDLKGTHVAQYIRWGEKQTFASRKSKAVPVPERSTCASRPVWYDLTTEKIGIGFWPKAQQYRHIVPANHGRLVCNCNLYTIVPAMKAVRERAALCAVLNSTIVALFKTYYGRYAGTEGNLKTEVIDVNLLDVPDPRGVSGELGGRMREALKSMQRRVVTHLVEEELMGCHSAERAKELAARPVELAQELRQADRRELDDAVLEMIGVEDAGERGRVLEELYEETARHFRQIRVVEIQKQEQRAGVRGGRLTAHDLAESVWDSLGEEEKGAGLAAWVDTLEGEREECEIAEGEAEAFGAGHMFEAGGVVFRRGKEREIVEYGSAERAALAAELGNLGIQGRVGLAREAETCKAWLGRIRERMEAARGRLEAAAGERTGVEKLREQTAQLLMQWFVQGKS